MGAVMLSPPTPTKKRKKKNMKQPSTRNLKKSQNMNNLRKNQNMKLQNMRSLLQRHQSMKNLSMSHLKKNLSMSNLKKNLSMSNLEKNQNMKLQSMRNQNMKVLRQKQIMDQNTSLMRVQRNQILSKTQLYNPKRLSIMPNMHRYIWKNYVV